MTDSTIAKKLNGILPKRMTWAERDVARFLAGSAQEWAQVQRREQLEEAIEKAAEAGIDVAHWIEFLDALDGDADLEPDWKNHCGPDECEPDEVAPTGHWQAG